MLFPSFHPALGSRRENAPAPTFPPPRLLLVSSCSQSKIKSGLRAVCALIAT